MSTSLIFLHVLFLSTFSTNAFNGCRKDAIIVPKFQRRCMILPKRLEASAISHSERSSSSSSSSSSSTTTIKEGKKSDNKAMAFLKKIGKVGGAANRDFSHVLGIDEGPSGKDGGAGRTTATTTTLTDEIKPRKSTEAYKSCTSTGLIDDMSEVFPFTSSGTQWRGITDRVMGGISTGSLTRETEFMGGQGQQRKRNANVLRGKVSLENNGGFVQMATDLALDPSISPFVDASKFHGVELDVLSSVDDDDNNQEKKEKKKNKFNVHLRNAACLRQFSSYRATFELTNNDNDLLSSSWQTIRIPWSEFIGYGPGADEVPLDVSTLRRIGIVGIGREMEFMLAVSRVQFYKE